MAIHLAINGFGRIGRLAFRQMFGDPQYVITAINDLTDSKMLAHLLQYDSSQGRYARAVSAREGALIVDGVEIPVLAQRDPAKLPWAAMSVDLVLECTGFFASKKKAQAHLDAGAKRVVISTAAGDDVPTIVFGVNEGTLTASDTIVSAASCTTNCLAPMVKRLHGLAPIVRGQMTTIHAYTNDQMLLDGPHPKGDLRRARSAAANIIPTSTGAAKAIGLVIPQLKGRLDGTSQRVPVVTGSLTELVAVVEGAVSREAVNATMRETADETFGYTEEPLVSSDIIGMGYGGLFDATQTKVMGMGGTSLVKIAAWYDNENSYTSQMVRTIRYLAGL